tara:strand:+ start:970 stop:1698 length:729 start_codon:yes stop_codon:yes gene_type:complete
MSNTITITTVSHTITITQGAAQTVSITNAAQQSATLSTNQGTPSLTGLTTDALSEGSTNQYYTNARASAAAPIQSVIANTGVADAGCELTTSEAGVASVKVTNRCKTIAVPSGFAASTVNGDGLITISYNNAASIRTGIGVTNVGAYTGQIETAANKTYTLDPSTATARTITGFYIKSGSGTVTAELKNDTSSVKSGVSVSTSSGDQSSLANTAVAINKPITIVLTSNSSATDVVYSVEYTE